MTSLPFYSPETKQLLTSGVERIRRINLLVEIKTIRKLSSSTASSSSSSLVQLCDIDIAHPYMLTVMEHMSRVDYDPKIDTKRDGCYAGVPGLACSHCSGNRSFFTKFDSFRKKSESVEKYGKHLVVCSDVPDDLRKRISELDNEYQKFKANDKNNYYSQRPFLQRVWDRLHPKLVDTNKDDASSEEGEADLSCAESDTEAPTSEADLREKWAVEWKSKVRKLEEMINTLNARMHAIEKRMDNESTAQIRTTLSDRFATEALSKLTAAVEKVAQMEELVAENEGLARNLEYTEAELKLSRDETASWKETASQLEGDLNRERALHQEVKDQLGVMEQTMAEQMKQLEEKNDELESLQLEQRKQSRLLQDTKAQLEQAQRRHEELEKVHAADYDGAMTELKAPQADLETKIEAKDKEISQLKGLLSEGEHQRQDMYEELKNLVDETNSQLEKQLPNTKDPNLRVTLCVEIKDNVERVNRIKQRMVIETTAAQTNANNADLETQIELRDSEISQLKGQLLKGEHLRREMHNMVQDLRGNIRVYVRIRQFLAKNGVPELGSPIDILPDGESLTIQDKKGKKHQFHFDKVYAQSSGQDVVFEDVSGFVQSALDGYHVCLFSYGQTGSGKTYTMQGSGDGTMRGIIPRVVEKILNEAANMRAQGWKFTIKASFLEIYNENIRDLLINADECKNFKSHVTRTSTATKPSIKRNSQGKSYVDGINEVNIDLDSESNGLKELKDVIALAAKVRSVAETNTNPQSSRSHSVFTLHLEGSNEDGTVVQGALNLCDLAGSERLKQSGVASDPRRLKETQAINKSLSCLGNVFNALATGSSHVPYRNSTLTKLLQDCLSGDGKALMFVNLSPTVQSSDESLRSLRFAERVNQVELGKAVRSVQYNK